MALPRSEDNEFEAPVAMYHVHVLFPPHSPEIVRAALAFRAELKAKFPHVFQTDVAIAAQAFFPVPNFALFFNRKSDFASILSHVTLHKPRGVSALVHPYLDRHEGDGGFRAMCVREHCELGFWIGKPYPLDEDCNGCFDAMDASKADHDELIRTIGRTAIPRGKEAEAILKSGWTRYRM